MTPKLITKDEFDAAAQDCIEHVVDGTKEIFFRDNNAYCRINQHHWIVTDAKNMEHVSVVKAVVDSIPKQSGWSVIGGIALIIGGVFVANIIKALMAGK